MSLYLQLMVFAMVWLVNSESIFALEKSTDALCKEAGELAVHQLNKRDLQAYQVAIKEQGFYQFFQLAEQVSKNKSYKTDKNKRVLQLICLEGFAAPAEIEGAVKDAYQHWKSGKDFIFDVCKYNTSGAGAGFCASRWSAGQEKTREKELSRLSRSVSRQQDKDIRQAYKLATQYFETKAHKEEFHGGSGHTAGRIESINAQKDLYIGRIENTLYGLLPEKFPDLKKANTALNHIYQKLRERLMIKPILDINMKVEFTDVRAVQKLWLEYRDITAALLADINNKTTLFQWQAILTNERAEELKCLLEYGESFP